MGTDLQAWLQARDWPRVLQHFTTVAPRTAAEFESRGLATRALHPDIDTDNRRAELLVGFAQTPVPAGAALKAALAAMQFAFDRLGMHKVMSQVHGDNLESQANTLHLGLRQEGLLRAHLRVGDQVLDMFVNGLLVHEFRADARLQRLLERWRVRQPR